MSNLNTKIKWTDATWSPITGCSKVSPGCKNCYAEAIADRFWKDRKFTDVVCHEDRLDAPLHWRKPRRVFVNSMSDLFHEDVPDEFILLVFGVMSKCPQHTFQILTKRSERMAHFMNPTIGDGGRLQEKMNAGFIEDWPWPLPHVQLVVSCENQPTADERIPDLLATPAAVRGVSLEPLLGPIDVNQWLFAEYGRRLIGAHPGISWVIVGGESGPNFRPMEIAWLESIVAQCRDAQVPVFVKQDSGRFPGKQGRIPNELWIQEFPK
jgi:protein gp37